jgi:hypothetical protein
LLFSPVFGEQGVEGILFNSVADKDERLDSLFLDAIVELFERVGNDLPQEIHWNRDRETGEDSVFAK